MLVSEFSTDLMQRTIDDINRSEKIQSIPGIPKTDGINPTYSTGNHWIGYIPIQNVLGRKWNNLELNLTRFSIPQMEMGSTEVSFKGYQYYVPTKVMDGGSKEITFDYIVDSKWLNYKSLYAWMSGLQGNINEVYDGGESGIATKDTLDVRVWLIDQFKNRILDLCFYDSWIRMFNDLALDSSSTDPVTHSVTFCYSHYQLTDITK